MLGSNRRGCAGMQTLLSSAFMKSPSHANLFRDISITFLFAGCLLLSGCGSSHEESEGGANEPKPIFKGQVVNVEYHLVDEKTVIIDSEGKKTELIGFPAIPRTNVEIYQHGREYEVFQTKQG